LIALGSNQRHRLHGLPRAVLDAALEALGRIGRVEAASAPIDSLPVGPSQRRYANAAAIVSSAFEPEDMLSRLRAIEAQFGRVRRGQRWRARVLDLDVILWSGGAWSGPHLTIPHRHYRDRPFVLTPAIEIAPMWRDPLRGLTVRQLHTRLTRPTPLP
jgi:2-amino-4-hydroxy-6-hydroxymethyldihydropteridine diphosphokinase